MSNNKALTLDAETGAPVGAELDAGMQDAMATCNRLHLLAMDCAQKAQSLATQAAHYAILIGLQLQSLKPSIAHGSWETLFGAEDEHDGRFVFSVESAKRYMRAAEGAVAARLNQKEAKALRASAATGRIDDQAAALLRKAADGQTLRQLYLDLGIIQMNAKERLESVRNTSGGRIALESITPQERARMALSPIANLLDKWRPKAVALCEGMPMAMGDKEWSLPEFLELIEHWHAAAKEAKANRRR